MAEFEHIGAIIQRVLENLWKQREEAQQQPAREDKDQGQESIEEAK